MTSSAVASRQPHLLPARESTSKTSEESERGGLRARYSRRNLESCARQLELWNPFSAAGSERSLAIGSSKDVSLDESLWTEECRIAPILSTDSGLGASTYGVTTPLSGQVDEGALAALQLSFTNRDRVFHGPSKARDEGIRQKEGVQHVACEAMRNLSISSDRLNGMSLMSQARVFNGLNPLAVGTQWFRCGDPADLEKESVVEGKSLPGSIVSYAPHAHYEIGKPSNYCEFVSNARPGMATCKISTFQGRRVRGWSKRRKQLSHALVRGLWRWREGVHVRKRIKRSGAGGSCNSGSGRSSDRTAHGPLIYISDPPTSTGGHIKCSDFPVTPTDSSGELFYCRVGTGINVLPELGAIGTEWATCVCHSCEGSDDGAECDHCWLAVDNQSVESGYDSEAGYRGDGELEFGDADDLDEEEREPVHLRVWREMMMDQGVGQHTESETASETVDAIIQGPSPDCMMELLCGRNQRTQKLQQRLRRRRSTVFSVRRL